MSRNHLESFTQEDAFKSWDQLEQAISKIYEKKFYDLSYEELYRKGYYLVLHRKGDFTYGNLQKCIKFQLKNYNSRLPQAQEDNFLQVFYDIWTDASEMMKKIAQIFLYMEKNYVPQKSLSPLKIVGYESFIDVYLRDPSFCPKFKQHVLGLIQRERDGMNIDRILLKNILRMLLELSTKANYSEQSQTPRPYGTSTYPTYNPQAGSKNICSLINDKSVYRDYFEKEFLEETEAYYTEEAQRSISSMTATEYLNKIEIRCSEELDRVNSYLDDASTKKPLLDIFIEVYVLKHAKTITEMGGIFSLFDNEMLEDARKVYRIFLLNESSAELFYNTFQDYQKKNLLKILEPPTEEDKDPLIVIRNLLNFHLKICRIRKALQEKDLEREKVFNKIVSDSFSQHINANTKPIIQLNIFLDYQFREGFKCLKDSEVETEFTNIIELFRYFSNKDIFEKNYKVFLSKRLLAGKSLSEDFEKTFVSKLQQECGPYFTAKIEIMFKDIALSSMITSEFHSTFSGNPQSQQSAMESIKAFDVRVLTMGNWPFQESSVETFNVELRNWTKMFRDFYINKYPGRTLKWILSQGTAEIKATFGGKKKELLVNTSQMCILLLFNSNKRLKVRDIFTQIIIPPEDVYNHIEVFTTFKIMNKLTGSPAEIGEEDEVEINDAFVHKSYRLKIPIKKIKEKGKDAEKGIMETVTIERKYWIEACIVRIMKSRKRLENVQLIEEVMKLTALHHFRPDISLIKKVIEELISKEYIDRDKDNKNVYIYLS